jgi:hypothetical protein
MDIIIFIKSINKIAVAAFFITFFLVGFEIYLLIKEKKTKEKPSIPEFKSNQRYGEIKAATVKKIKEEKAIYKKPNLKLMIVFIILMFLFGGLFLIGRLVKVENNKRPQNMISSSVTKTLTSAGIKIYNEKWEEISDDKLSFLKKGDKILVAIKNIAGADINKARIRINSNKWQPEEEITNLNQELNIFYKEYQIATNETQLKIEAQLHSQKDGWLGE